MLIDYWNCSILFQIYLILLFLYLRWTNSAYGRKYFSKIKGFKINNKLSFWKIYKLDKANHFLASNHIRGIQLKRYATRNNETDWNLSIPLWDEVVRYPGTRIEYPAWLRACVGVHAWYRGRSMVSYVFHPIYTTMRVRTSWLSHCKILRLKSSDVLLDFLLQQVSFNETPRCSSIIEFYNRKAMISSHALLHKLDGTQNCLLLPVLHDRMRNHAVR